MKIAWFASVLVAVLFVSAAQAQDLTGWSSVSNFSLLPNAVKTYQQWVNSGETVLIESLAGKIFVALQLGNQTTTTADGATMITWPYYVSKPQSTLEWKLIPSDEKGYYYIVSTYDSSTRIINQVGSACSLLTINGNTESGKVYFEDAGNGYYYILYKTNNQALQYNSTNAHEYTQKLVTKLVADQPEFKWRILVPDSIPRLDITNQTVILSSAKNDVFISLVNGTHDKSGPLHTTGYTTKIDIQWKIVAPGSPVVGYYYLMTEIDNNKIMQQEGKVLVDGGPVKLWTRSDLTNTELAFRDAGNDYVNLVFRHSGFVVRIDPTDSTILTQWQIIDAPEYKWKFMNTQNTAPVNVFSTPCCQ
eukprot:TRINITY_DN1174_c0_g1_i1.p1 TRINITY_DN1174_c0_g1~~TRINITY_DN1174_c0_g1_i1.p1  ORF type:complete len:361 (-),score=49.02 TRINITY_DN1174_c0_g1_i1:44-1126(-)